MLQEGGYLHPRRTTTKSEIQVFEYPNGFRIIHEPPNNHLPITSINMYCDVGSAYEHATTHGISHFIEHMLFKGSDKYTHSRDIFDRYDQYGIKYNAVTEKRFTRYTLKTQNEYLEECLKIMADTVLKSTFPKNEFKKEERVVIEENIQSSDDHSEALAIEIERQLYRGSSYESPVDTLMYHTHGKHFKYSDVLGMYRRFYQPDNLILSVVTNISLPKIRHFLEKTAIVKSGVNPRMTRPCIMQRIRPQMETKYILKSVPNLHTSYIYIGFRTCSLYSSDKYILNLLRNLLGGYLSSKLFMMLREQHGLTYTSSVSTTYYEHMGDITMYAEMDRTKVMKNEHTKGVLPLLIDMLCELKKSGISKKELDVAKTNLRGKIIMHLENSDVQSEYNGRELLYMKNREQSIYVNSGQSFVPFSAIYNAHYKSISVDDVNRVIHKYFTPNIMTVGIIGTGIGTGMYSLSSVQEVCSHFV